jgi:ABC-type multidrug transport system ATPase subunit
MPGGDANVVDAFTSYLLLLTLSQLARRGRTVILSIHAPRSDAFPLFDRISLLSKGQVVYSGHRRDCLGWFASLEHNLVAGVNPLGTFPTFSWLTSRLPHRYQFRR